MIRTIGNIRYRTMQLKDVPEQVRIIATHPHLASEYGPTIKKLPAALRRVLGHNSLVALAFEEVQGSKVKVLGGCFGAFVNDDFLRELKTVRSFRVGPLLQHRHAGEGQFPRPSAPRFRRGAPQRRRLP